jgi:hypothetical protein
MNLMNLKHSNVNNKININNKTKIMKSLVITDNLNLKTHTEH